MTSVIQGRNLKKSYRLGNLDKPVLCNVNIQVKRGEFLTIAGPSGSGKSTLLRILGCIEKADAGEVNICGEDISLMSSDALSDLRAHRIGFIFQSFNLLPILNAFENVEYPLKLNGTGRKERKVQVFEWLTRVGIADHAKQRPDQLSGGQQQRVAIARALVGNAEVVFADEPTANLDSRTGGEVLQLMKQLNREREVTFVLATHDPEVMKVADRVLHVRDGKIEQEERR